MPPLSTERQLTVLLSGMFQFVHSSKTVLLTNLSTQCPKRPKTSGGEVEHEVYMTEGIILLVFELKLQLKDEGEHVAQVLLELVCESCAFLYQSSKLKRSSSIQTQ